MPVLRWGDTVVGMGGWQTHSVVDADAPGMLRTVSTAHIPASAYLGAVGMPGVTAWMGSNANLRTEIRRDRRGDCLQAAPLALSWVSSQKRGVVGWSASRAAKKKCALRNRYLGLRCLHRLQGKRR